MTKLEVQIQEYFGITSAKEVSLAGEFFKLELLKKGDYYCTEEGPCNKLSFIAEGNMRIFKYRDGKDITQWVATKNELVTDLASLMFKSPSRWNIQCLSDCELYTIHSANYQNLEKSISDWKNLENKFLAKCFITLEDRVFSFISMTAEERFNHFMSYKKELFNQVPSQYLASIMGMTPETLSRLRKKKLS